MAGTISREENDLVRELKADGTLKRIIPDSFNEDTIANSVAIMCGDGDPDFSVYHARLVRRPHCVRIFGGSLLFAHSFREHRPSFANCLVENLKVGMTVKQTRTLFLYFHAPCGMATLHGCGILDQLKFAAEAKDFFAGYNFFDPALIHTLFHVKRINRAGVLEQNTYRIALEHLSGQPHKGGRH